MTIPVGSRVPNMTLRSVRLRLMMSQSEFATAVRRAGAELGEPNAANKRLVQKWESGEHARVRNHYQRALMVVTRLPLDKLGFNGAAASCPPSGAVPDIAVPVPESSGASPGEGLGLLVDPAERLRFALEQPALGDRESVAMLEAATGHLFEWEQERAAWQVAAAVGEHLDRVCAMLLGSRSWMARQRLAATGGGALALAGWLAFECADAETAYRCWDGALTAAQCASDGPLRCCVMVYKSYSAAERGDLVTARTLARAALGTAGPSRRARGWVSARVAELSAMLGEREIALEELAAARGLGGDLDAWASGEGCPVWARAFDAGVLAATEAGAYARLGESRAARAACRRAMASVSGEKLKAQAAVLAMVACASVRIGDVRRAIESAHAAIDLADQCGGVIAERALRAMPGLLTAHRGTNAVRELLARLSVRTS